MTTDTSVVYSLSLIHAKPDCLVKLLHMLPKGQKIYEAHGAKQLGVWITETGVMNKIVRLVEWPSLEKRMTCMTARFTDPEMRHYFEKCRHYYTYEDTFVCRSDTKIPMGHIHHSKPLLIKRFHMHKSEALASQSIRHWAKVKGNALKEDEEMVAFLHPLFYSDRCLFTLWQVKDTHNYDRLVKTYVDFIRNPDHFEMMEEINNAVTKSRCVICSPVDFTKLPSLP